MSRPHDRNRTLRTLPPALDLLRHVWDLNHALAQLSAKMERDLGVTAQQRHMIRCIGLHPDISAGELAQLLCVDPGTVTATVRRLTEKGLIERHSDPRDHRHVWLALTEQGRSVDAATAGTVEDAAVALLAEVGAESAAGMVATIDRLTALLHDRAGR